VILTLDVSGLVDTVDVAKAGSDGEERRDGGQLLVDVVDVFGLSVERVVVNVLVVDTILLSSSDTNFHLNHLLDWGSALKVLLGGGNVPLLGLLRKI
jgi:hypothetical protein